MLRNRNNSPRDYSKIATEPRYRSSVDAHRKWVSALWNILPTRYEKKRGDFEKLDQLSLFFLFLAKSYACFGFFRGKTSRRGRTYLNTLIFWKRAASSGGVTGGWERSGDRNYPVKAPCLNLARALRKPECCKQVIWWNTNKRGACFVSSRDSSILDSWK